MTEKTPKPPVYESEEDRRNEEEVIRLVEKRFRCLATKMPMEARLDYLLRRYGVVIAVAEVKCRTCSSTTYGEIYLSLSKWEAGVRYADTDGVKFVVLFRFKDKAMFYIYDREDLPRIKRKTGRTVQTRPDAANDIEDCVMIPVNKMEDL